MYILAEVPSTYQDSRLVIVKALYRQIKAASVDGWKLLYQERLKNVDDYCDKTKPNPSSVQYEILCWDERPDQNVLLGTWKLHSPPLERGKAKDNQKEAMMNNIAHILHELESASVPSLLWNKYMTYTPAATEAQQNETS